MTFPDWVRDEGSVCEEKRQEQNTGCRGVYSRYQMRDYYSGSGGLLIRVLVTRATALHFCLEGEGNQPSLLLHRKMVARVDKINLSRSATTSPSRAELREARGQVYRDDPRGIEQ